MDAVEEGDGAVGADPPNRELIGGASKADPDIDRSPSKLVRSSADGDRLEADPVVTTRERNGDDGQTTREQSLHVIDHWVSSGTSAERIDEAIVHVHRLRGEVRVLHHEE